MLDNFIQTEITEVNSPEHDEFYLAIRAFIQSAEIRRGEFEGHCFIINKIDRNTFIIYEEHQLPEKTIYSNSSIIVDKESILRAIDSAAKKIGIHVPKDTP